MVKGGVDCRLPALERNPEVASVPQRADVERGAASLTSVPTAIQAYQGGARPRLDTLLKADLNDPRQRLLLARELEQAGLLREAAAEYLELQKTWNKQPRLLKLALDLEHPGPSVRSLVQPQPQRAPRGKGSIHALVIGISKYEDPSLDLKFADHDADAFTQYLETPRGGATDVVPLLNEKARVSQIRNQFLAMLSRVKENDTLVVYVASHGDMLDNEVPRILTYRANRQEPGINAMPLAEIRKYMLGGSAPYREARIFLDVCHAGDVALLQPPRRPSEGKRKNPASHEIAAAPDFFALTASNQGPDAYAYEDELFDRHGVFTYFLLRGLNSHDATDERILTYGALGIYVQSHVAAATRTQQYPAMTTKTDLNRMIADLNQSGLPHFDTRPYETLRLPPEKLQRQGGRRAPQENGGPLPSEHPPASSDMDQRIALEDRGEAILLRYLRGDEVPQKKPAFADCSRIFADALALQPGSPYLEARRDFCEGRALLFDKHYPEAIEDLENSIRLDPTAAYAYNALGIAYLEQADYQNARRAFQDAIERAAKWAYPRHNLALTYTEDGDFEEAVRTYQAAMHLAPGYFYLPYNLGLVYQRMNRPREAADQYELAQSRAPNRVEPITALAMLQAKQGKRDEAILSLRQAIDMKEQEPNAIKAARHDLAVLLAADTQTVEEAIGLWQQNGSYPSSQLSLAEALEALSREREAAQVYRSILDEHHDHTSARLKLVAQLERAGHAADAVDELKAALEYLPENAIILAELGKASTLAGRKSEAREYYERALNETDDRGERRRIRKAMHDLERLR